MTEEFKQKLDEIWEHLDPVEKREVLKKSGWEFDEDKEFNENNQKHE